MTAFNGFEELGRKIEELAEQFESRATGRISGSGQDPVSGEFISPEGFKPKQRIGVGIQRALDEDIIRQMRTSAKRYVPDNDAETIDFRRGGWNRWMIGGNDMVSYHEFGTSTRATEKSRATINAPNGNGYVIPINGYDSLPFDAEAVETMDELNFQFFVHPGVEAQHFIEETLKGNTLTLEERVAEELDKIEIDI